MKNTEQYSYKIHDENIPNLIDKTKSLEHQARQACELRNQNRMNARELMADKKLREKLEKSAPNHSFEFYYKRYKTEHNTDEDIYKIIIDKSTTTNKEADKEAGVKQ